MKANPVASEVGRDWVDGPYYDEAEAVMDAQWRLLLWPLIEGCDFTSVLDLAAGHGRNSAKLLPLCQALWLVDINRSNIEFLRRRFGADSRVTYVQNNGADLAAVPDGSITFLYCFDAMVHFDSDVVRSYLREFRRVLRPGGRVFCHYSNYDGNPTGSYREHPGWRNFMSRALYEHYAAKEGLEVVQSWYVHKVAVIVENPGDDIDAMTLLSRP